MVNELKTEGGESRGSGRTESEANDSLLVSRKELSCWRMDFHFPWVVAA